MQALGAASAVARQKLAAGSPCSRLQLLQRLPAAAAVVPAAIRSSAMAPRLAKTRATSAGGGDGGGSSGEGARTATSLLDTAEQSVEQLERAVGTSKAEAHLGPAPSAEAPGEPANVWYFAYGSNINKKVFEGRRMIKPAESRPAVLPGWLLTFNQPGLPFSEPAFAAVELREGLVAAAAGAPTAANGSGEPRQPDAHGVAHRITQAQWQYVLETEGASGPGNDHAYKVVEARAVTYDGQELRVLTLSVSPKVKARLQGRAALPSQRYLTLIREGAEDFGLSPEYRQWLAGLQHYQATRPGQKVGMWIFRVLAFTFIFPVWASVRLLRRFTGMEKAAGDRVAHWMGRYNALVFGSVHVLHEALRPLLGCGVSNAAPRRE